MSRAAATAPKTPTGRAAKVASKSSALIAAPEVAAPATVSKKPIKPRAVLVRDSFTMPEADFALIAALKATALEGKRAAKKSELLRAGLQMLAGLDTESLVVALNRLATIKTGRPKKGH
jgi:hypothetical protein